MSASLTFVTVLGSATIGQAPLNIIPMIWCLLIIEILATLALGTDPHDATLPDKRTSRKE